MRRAGYAVILLAFLSVSCIFEGKGDCNSCEEENNYLSLTLRVPSSSGAGGTRSTPSPATRYEVPADDLYNENYIDFNGADRQDLHIFFFKQDEMTCIFYPEPERLGWTEGPNGERYVRIQLTGVDSATDLDPADIVGETIVMYVVANSGLSRNEFLFGGVAMYLHEIQQIVMTADFNNLSGASVVPQEKFVMEGKQTVYVSGATNMASIALKRAASKIQMGIYKADIDGYTAESAEVKLVNFVNMGAIGADGNREYYTPAVSDYASTDYITVPGGHLSQAGAPEDAAYTEPLYSYPNDWSGDQSREAYLLLKVSMRNNSTSAVGDYYYKIPVSDIPSDTENGAAFRNRLRRNYIYRYYVSLSELGGPNPETPATLSNTNLDIETWDGNNQIAVKIFKFDWLFVDEQNITMYPTTASHELGYVEYYIPYRSSSPISLSVPVSAWYESYNADANDSRETIYYTSGHHPEQIPEINLNAVNQYGERSIYIKSAVPDNYVPKHIYIKVDNPAHLFAEINGIHYPAIYVVGTRSNSSSGSNVKYIYTITTLALTGDEVFDWDWWRNDYNGVQWRQHPYTIGNAFIKNANGTFRIKDEKDNAWVVSPKLMVQSSVNVGGTMTIGEARSRCDRYTENGLSGWRLPSIAELYLIYKLQTEGKSAINGAMAPTTLAKRAWSDGTWLLNGDRAYSFNWLGNISSSIHGAVFNMNRPGSGGLFNDRPASGTGAYSSLGSYVHVPICVRDVYQ